jgi:glycosyltransferase involved in cell wall biosynthesis
MNVIQVTNFHRFGGGADIVAEATTNILKRKNQEVLLISRDSRQLGRGLIGKIKAFVTGIYSISGRRTIAKLIRERRPDIVHVHELYPFFSPWVLRECRLAGVPVVMTCHDYRLTCPTALHYRSGKICELCVGGKEYWCILKNCRCNIYESTGYSLRNLISRKLRLFRENVTCYITPTEFVKLRLVNACYPRERIMVIPNAISVPESQVNASCGKYIAYAGRFSLEKGIETFLAASRQIGLPICLAGDYTPMAEIIKKGPANARFLGHLKREQLDGFYQNARFLVVPSNWFEVFGLVVAEAMAHGLPVIASRVGGLPEIIDEGVTGLLFTPGDVEELAYKMKFLWDNPKLCKQMGQAGRQKVIREYSEDVYFGRLMAVYEKAIQIEKNTGEFIN